MDEDGPSFSQMAGLQDAAQTQTQPNVFDLLDQVFDAEAVVAAEAAERAFGGGRADAGQSAMNAEAESFVPDSATEQARKPTQHGRSRVGLQDDTTHVGRAAALLRM